MRFDRTSNDNNGDWHDIPCTAVIYAFCIICSANNKVSFSFTLQELEEKIKSVQEKRLKQHKDEVKKNSKGASVSALDRVSLVLTLHF